MHTIIADSAYKPKVDLLTLLHSSLSLIYQSLVHTYDATQPRHAWLLRTELQEAHNIQHRTAALCGFTHCIDLPPTGIAHGKRRSG